MTDDDQPRPRKRVRKRRRKRRQSAEAPDDPPPRGEEVIEVGSGNFAVLTIEKETGDTVVHRFETQEEAREQYRRNVLDDNPLAQHEKEVN